MKKINENKIETSQEKIRREDNKTLLLLCILASCVAMAISVITLFIMLG